MSTSSTAWLTGKFDPAASDQFRVLPAGICEDSIAIQLHSDAGNALIRMIECANKDDISLKVVSGFRSFYRQREIWNGKWDGSILTQGDNLAVSIPDPFERALRILRFSAMPGTSRHHWGTDVDLNSVEPEYFDTEQGRQVYAWLQQNALSFGFAQPYTAKGIVRPWGYEEEKWHWSYLPLSKKLLSDYNACITYHDLMDFEGSSTAEALQVIERYVNGIDPSCKV